MLSIEPQQDPLRDSQQEGLEESPPYGEDLAEPERQFYLPQSSASNALNALIRLLIVKLPRDGLVHFQWDHCCELDASTLNLLFERQAASLQIFLCNRYSSSCDSSGSVIEGIRRLSFEGMDFDRGGCKWAATMIAENAETLDYLALGFKTRIAQDFAHKIHPPYDQMSTAFASDVKDVLSESYPEPLIHLSLNSLQLCGLDLGGLVCGEMALDIDFNNISELRLESCPGLTKAFSLLTGQGKSSTLALNALEDLFVRLENPNLILPASLESFLTSIRGLTHLQVLIDKARAVQNLEPILKYHGKTLKSLVWDERRGPRKRLDECTSLLSTKFGNLRVISQNCPFLTNLGIPLDWDTISCSDKYHETIAIYFRRMPNLELLNIRNLPTLQDRISVIPTDYFVKGLAAMFLDAVNKKRTSASFRTIALGSPLYRDMKVGTHHVAHTCVSDFLRFRVYNVDYAYPSPSGLSTVLSELVKGAVINDDETFTPEYLLNDYWLG